MCELRVLGNLPAVEPQNELVTRRQGDTIPAPHSYCYRLADEVLECVRLAEFEV